MGAMYVDDLDLYTWKDAITDPFELMLQAQREVTQWSLLLNATGVDPLIPGRGQTIPRSVSRTHQHHLNVAREPSWHS
jgi:hypothetical protein